MNMEPNRDHFIGAWAMSAYIYNTSGSRFVRDLFPGEHPRYQAEKAETWGHSPSRAIGFLDDHHFRRLVEIAIDRHGSAARQRAGDAGFEQEGAKEEA